MLRSLEKLKNGGIWGEDCFGFLEHKAQQLAKEIQAEIDRFYLPRPLFEDGEPVQFGDRFVFNHEVREVSFITYSIAVRGDEYFIEISDEAHCSKAVFSGDRLQRPVEPDTQEKIDEDAVLYAREYCQKYGIECYENLRDFEKCQHLLARQRKLDGVE